MYVACSFHKHRQTTAAHCWLFCRKMAHSLSKTEGKYKKRRKKLFFEFPLLFLEFSFHSYCKNWDIKNKVSTDMRHRW